MTFSLVDALAAVAALLVGLSKGGIPSVGMIAVPLLALSMPPFQATMLLLPIYIISDLVGVWLYRRDYSSANLKILIPSGLFGVFVGWLTAAHVSDAVVAGLIGLIGMGFCLRVWRSTPQSRSQPVLPNRARGWFWGTIMGFTSFIAHAGGPPFQVYTLPQRLPKVCFAGTATLVFAVINAAKIVPYQSVQPYSTAMLGSAVLLVPFALVGTIAGAVLTRYIAEAWFSRLVLISLFGVSFKLLVDAVTLWK